MSCKSSEACEINEEDYHLEDTQHIEKPDTPLGQCRMQDNGKGIACDGDSSRPPPVTF